MSEIAASSESMRDDIDVTSEERGASVEGQMSASEGAVGGEERG
jgi:hypothetical protein